MLIIKHGDKERINRIKELVEFTCTGCGCQYVIGRDEYRTVEPFDDPTTVMIFHECPECGTSLSKRIYRHNVVGCPKIV